MKFLVLLLVICICQEGISMSLDSPTNQTNSLETDETATDIQTRRRCVYAGDECSGGDCCHGHWCIQHTRRYADCQRKPSNCHTNDDTPPCTERLEPCVTDDQCCTKVCTKSTGKCV